MKKNIFIKAALKDHRIGAFTRSSPFTIKRILDRLKKHHTCIVEYGAGDGIITKKILGMLPDDGKLIAIEINNDLLHELRAIRDTRLTVVKGDVQTLSNDLTSLADQKIDAIISGIPFSFFNQKIREKIIANTGSTLKPGGMFIVYQYSPLVLPLLKKYFTKVHVQYEMRNFLPYFIMAAEK